jgi:hypothetical protein
LSLLDEEMSQASKAVTKEGLVKSAMLGESGVGDPRVSNDIEAKEVWHENK